MPGFLLHLGAQVQCVHVGQAQPTSTTPRVFVMGQSIVTQANLYAIVGCTFPALSGGTQPPCVTAQWTSAATRVFANQLPVLLLDSQALCTPTGTPLLILATQMRVTGM
jgi:hypothetical protein